MYKKEMRRAAALLAVCWLGLLFRAAAETPAEKLERLRAEQQAIEQQIEQNRTDAARAGDLVNLYTAKEQNVKAQIAVLQLKIQECEAQLAGTQAQVAAKLLEVDRSTQSFEARMKGMYEMSRQSGLAVLLGADSLSEMLTFGEYLQRIAVRDTRLIAELTARREELAALAARQQAELDALDASNAELEAAANGICRGAAAGKRPGFPPQQAAEQAGAGPAFAAKEQEIAAAEREYAEWGRPKRQQRARIHRRRVLLAAAGLFHRLAHGLAHAERRTGIPPRHGYPRAAGYKNLRGGGRCCQHKSTLHVRHLCQAEPWRRAGDHLRPYVRLGRGHRRRRPCQAGPAHRLCGPNGSRIWISPAFRGEPERRAVDVRDYLG